MLRLLHYTDTHTNTTAPNIVKSLMDAGLADVCVHTGDGVHRQFEDDFTSNPGHWPYVIGNHDSAKGMDWTKNASEGELIRKYQLLQNPVDYDPGHTWWTKTVNGILLVGLNVCKTPGTYDREVQWLTSVLDGATQSKTPVIILSHIMDGKRDTTIIKCSFTNEYYLSLNEIGYGFTTYYPAIGALESVVLAAKAKGCDIICQLHGHEHSDAVLISGGILHVICGSCECDYYNDVCRSRDAGFAANLVANLYEINPDNHTLSIRRMGATMASGWPRKRIDLDYTTAKVLTDWR